MKNCVYQIAADSSLVKVSLLTKTVILQFTLQIKSFIIISSNIFIIIYVHFKCCYFYYY